MGFGVSLGFRVAETKQRAHGWGGLSFPVLSCPSVSPHPSMSLCKALAQSEQSVGVSGVLWGLFSILGQYDQYALAFQGTGTGTASAPLHNALLTVLEAYPEC